MIGFQAAYARRGIKLELGERLAGAARIAGEEKPRIVPWDEPRGDVRSTATSKLHSVPDLPPHYLVRADLHERVVSALLADEGQTNRRSAVGLHGMAGIGKTVTASAVARDPRIYTRYRDGVVWLTVGMGRTSIAYRLS